ncbi:MAG: ABC transporter permease, partial [Kiritimatiellia bacterium]
RGGEFFTLHLLGLPLLFLLHAWFNLGCAMLLSAMNVYYRDTQHLVGVLLSALFFMSPAMYDLDFVTRLAGEMHPMIMNLYALNPMAGILSAYRWAFLPGTPFPQSPWLWAGMAWPLLFTLLAGVIFRRAQRNFADFV